MASIPESALGGSFFVRPDGCVRIGVKGDEPLSVNIALVEVFVAECNVVAMQELTAEIGGVKYRLIKEE